MAPREGRGDSPPNCHSGSKKACHSRIQAGFKFSMRAPRRPCRGRSIRRPLWRFLIACGTSQVSGVGVLTDRSPARRRDIGRRGYDQRNCLGVVALTEVTD